MDTKFVSLAGNIRQLQPVTSPSGTSVEKTDTVMTSATKPAEADENTPVSSDSVGKPRAEENKEATADVSLNEVVEELNRNIQQTNRALKFTIDDRHGKPVISVVDKATDEVIRQIPSEVALQVSDALEEVTGALVSEHA